MKWGRIGEGRGGDLRTSKAREGKGRVSPPSNPEPNLADDCSTRQTRSARPTLSYCVPCTSPRTLVCLFLNSCSSMLRLVGQQLSVLSSSVSHRLELHYFDLWYNKLRNLWQAQLVVEQIHNTYIGWQWRNFVSHLCQLVFAVILWAKYLFTYLLKLLQMFAALMSLKYAVSVGWWSRGRFLELSDWILFEQHGKSSPINSTKFYPIVSWP